MLKDKRILINRLINNISPNLLFCDVCDIKSFFNIGRTDVVNSYYKFYYITKGNYQIEINGQSINTKPGNLYMIPSDVRHSYCHNDINLEMFCCHFNPTIDIFGMFNYSKEALSCKIDKESILPIYNSIIAIKDDHSVWATLQKKSLLLSFIALYMKEMENKILTEPYYDKFVNKVNEFVLRFHDRAVKMDDLADFVGVHPNYLPTIFKRYYNTTPVKYINNLRLENAAKCLIMQNDYKIEDVAQFNGFSDYRYFSRIFKNKYGVSPSEYRKQNSG